jgi:hypothetical protein
MNNFQRCLAAVATTFLVSGCSLTAPPYSPNYETIDNLKRVDAEKMSVGEVQPNDPNAPVNSISLRGSKLTASNGTFSGYLENAIRSDLIEMGLYDPTSTTRIDATILKNDIDVSGISSGSGVMEVKLTITKNATLAFEKVYTANTQFESSFAGAVAVPKGQNEYPNLVRTLLDNVYNDPAFIEVVKK